MCECGCAGNDKRYKFPGPGKSFYLLTLSGGCINCDYPSGLTVERIKPGDYLHEYLKDNREHYIDGDLKFEKWTDSEGVGIVTGFRRQEFIAALLKHLVGISSVEMGENGKIDAIGAGVILEEMFEDSVVEPHFYKEPPHDD